ncbi:MAG: NDP-sugar synthase [bacterium]|nr:NDP-sugar synthase [bacterium]
MRALILAGGKGTRLRPLTVYTPKPVVPVLNRPFLTYQLDLLRKAGITDVTLSLSYQPDKIEDVLGDGSDFGVKLNFVTEPSALGTAGAVRFAIEGASEPVLVLNGDILTDLDLSTMVQAHTDRKDQITIALTRVEDPTKYGLVAMNSDGSIESFIEKPKDGTFDGSPNTINAGIYILEPSAFDLIPKGANSSFEYDVFPKALEQGLAFSGYVLDDNYWQDIGTPESYLSAHLDILSGKAGFALGDRTDSTETSPTAYIENSIIGEGCVIKPNAKIIDSVLGPGVHVEEKVVIENSVLWAHTRVSSFAKIRGSVVGKGCHVGKDAELRAGSVLGDKAMIPDYSVV